MRARHLTGVAWQGALVLPLLLQLWAMSTCCLPSSLGGGDGVFGPGGTLVICSGSGQKTINLGDGEGGMAGKGGHGDMCGGLCSVAALPVLLLGAVIFFTSRRLFSGVAVRTLLPRGPPAPYHARGPPAFA